MGNTFRGGGGGCRRCWCGAALSHGRSSQGVVHVGTALNTNVYHDNDNSDNKNNNKNNN